METAIRLFSRKGLMIEEVKAVNIKSYADARKLGPFVDIHGKPVYWKNWSKKKTSKGRHRTAHFSKYPFGRVRGKLKQIDLEEEHAKAISRSESEVHKKARIELAQYLSRVVKDGGSIAWAFKNAEVSDFAFTGNILEGVERVETNFKYTLKEFGLEFEYDIALLGRTVGNEPIIMSAIEIEKTHRFEPLKLIASKSLSFPLMSINIEGCTEDDITTDWCVKAVSETKRNSEDELRRNYMYLHDMLIPLYLNIPSNFQPDGKHALVIFAKPSSFEKLLKYLRAYQEKLGFENQRMVHIDKVNLNPNNEDSRKMFENEGSMAGHQWAEYNNEQYIRITLSTNGKKNGGLLLFFHILVRLVNTYADAIVGYKLAKGIKNYDVESPYWYSSDNKKIAPKTLSEPLVPVLEHFKEWGIIDRIKKLQSV